MSQSCAWCAEEFEIRAQDLSFYERVGPVFAGRKFPVPPPTLCPHCRWQRRLAFRNERTLYRRSCDLTGQSIVAQYRPEARFPVYEVSVWRSDRWDAREYGRDFDFSRPFFEQFAELMGEVPHFNRFADPELDVNSEYTHCSGYSKNCYLISQARGNEACMYSRGVTSCRDCVDCLRIDNSELCYESVNLERCYHCLYCQDCESCNDCSFSTHLRSCHHCFGCHGLLHKEYHFFNEPLAKEEWEKRVNAIRLTPSVIRQYRQQSEALRLKVPQRSTTMINCEDSVGDHIYHCRDSYHIFDSHGLEHCAYCYEIPDPSRYCYDYSMWGEQAELMYECGGVGTSSYQDLFCFDCWQNISYLTYCAGCTPSVSHCFGCYGLRRAEYCVLNKQYSADEYERLAPRIIEHMIETGEWGEFFPVELSPFGYNETVAQDYFPLAEREVRRRGWRWTEEKSVTDAGGLQLVTQSPESIEAIDESVLDAALQCEETGRLYRITRPELQFYRRLGTSLPLRHPDLRHTERTRRLNSRRIWQRECSSCRRAVATCSDPARAEKVFCEPCYRDYLVT